MALSPEQLAQVETLIKSCHDNLSQTFGQYLQQGQQQVAQVQGIIDTHNTELHASANRVTAVVEIVNAKYAEFDSKLAAEVGRTAAALDETKLLDANLTELKTNIDAYANRMQASVNVMNAAAETTRSETVVEFGKMRRNMELWYEGIKADIMKDGAPEFNLAKGERGDDKKKMSMDKTSVK